MARILLVDDDPSVLALEKLTLAEAGYDILTASDARSALQTLRFYDVDLVITDVSMPDIDGFRMVHMMRSEGRNKNLRVAFFTAKSDTEAVVQAGKLQADFYVTKPVQRKELLDKVSGLFAKYPPSHANPMRKVGKK